MRELLPIVGLFVAGVGGAAHAVNHQLQIFGVQAGANGDSRIQAVEIRADLGQNQWGPASPGGQPRAELAFFDAFGEQVFVFQFPNNPPQNSGTIDACGLTSVLIATQQFQTAYGLSAEFTIPPQKMPTQAGSVCFRSTPASSFPINICVSYGTPQVCSGNGACCITNANCPAGQTCVAPDIANGLIPFTDKIGGDGLSFGDGPAGCPALALPVTGVVGLQRAPNGPGCCHAEFCHMNSSFLITNNPVFKNAAGNTASLLTASTLVQGTNLFTLEIFNGNGRDCESCHIASDGFGLRPETVAAKFLANPLDPLFVAEFIPGLAALEDPCLMRQGNQRSLILENVHGLPPTAPVFRTSPHLMNVRHTGDFGLSPEFGGSPSLVAFCQGAVTQHFPRRLPRNNDPNSDPVNGLLSNRAGTIVELTFMEEFQESIKTVVNDGQGDLKGPGCGECAGGPNAGLTCCSNADCPASTCTITSDPVNREDNLDRLIAAFLLACPNADPIAINRGRQTFNGIGCLGCHRDPFLGLNARFQTGVVNDPGNLNTGCPLSPLPSEDTACANDPLCSPPMAFDTRPLVDLARVRSGISNPNLGVFFHDGVVRTLQGSVAFYNSPAFQNSPTGGFVQFDPDPVIAQGQISDITRFLEAIVQADPNSCPSTNGACCFAAGGCQEMTQAECESFTTVCTTFMGVGTDCTSADLCPSNPIGACCFSDGTCNDDFVECDCLASGGHTWHEGEFCFGNPPFVCPPIVGACCMPNGTCEVTTKEKCLDQCGEYAGDDTVCGEQCCLPTKRPCCFRFPTPQNPDGCTDALLPCECEAQGGVPREVGLTCGDLNPPCAPPCINPNFRACCLPTGGCIVTTQCACTGAGGLWFPNRPSCSTVFCPVLDDGVLP